MPEITTLKPYLRAKPRGKADIVEGIVLHATAGSTSAGAIATLRQRRLSYHALIEDQKERDGHIIKCVPYGAAAYHAGNSRGPRQVRRGLPGTQTGLLNWSQNQSVNMETIGISFINRNDGRDPYSAAQIESCIWLIQRLKEQFPTIRWISGHRDVSPGRKNDPKGLDIQAIADAVDLPYWRQGDLLP